MEGWMAAVLVEVWLDESYCIGVPCRAVRLLGREDGTFDLGLTTTYAELAAAGVRVVADEPERDREALRLATERHGDDLRGLAGG